MCIRDRQNATYYVVEGVNVRSDCSTEAQMITGTTAGQELTSTGVSEDGQWVEVTINGQTGYVSAQYVSTTCLLYTSPVVCFLSCR